MTNEALKISLAQRILSLSNNVILEKINNLLNQEVVIGYEVDGTPITQEKFIAEMKQMDVEIENETFEGFSSEEVRNHILGK